MNHQHSFESHQCASEAVPPAQDCHPQSQSNSAAIPPLPEHSSTVPPAIRQGDLIRSGDWLLKTLLEWQKPAPLKSTQPKQVDCERFGSAADGIMPTMGISETIAKYQAEVLKKQQQEREQMESEKARRSGNAREVEAHLRSVVLPVLEYAREEIIKSGCRCSIESVSLHDPNYGETAPTFVLKLKLGTGAEKQAKTASLHYEGQFSFVTIRKVEILPNATSIEIVNDPNDDGFRPLNHFNADTIKRQVENFVDAVFRPV